jgi:hypothetical protein
MFSSVSAAARQVNGVAERRLIAAGVLWVCAVVLAQTAAQLIDYRFFGLRLKVIRSDTDGGIFGVIGVIALFLTSAAAWVALASLPTLRRPLEVLAPLTTFLALDKALRLHDHVPHWLLLYLPLLAAVFLSLLEIARRADFSVRLLIIGAVLLLGFAFAIHQYGDAVLVRLDESSSGWMYQLKGVTKHGAELAGWLFVALAITALSLSNGEAAATRTGRT